MNANTGAAAKADSAIGKLRPAPHGQFKLRPVPAADLPEWNARLCATPGARVQVTPLKPARGHWTEEQTAALCAALHVSPSQRAAAITLGMSHKAVVARVHRLRELGDTRLPAPCAKPGKAFLPLPDDFAELARNCGNDRLIARYAVSKSTIARWRKETGTVRRQFKGPRATPQDTRPTPDRAASSPRSPHVRFKVDRVVNRDISKPGEAAEYLRRFGPVYRCDEKGNPEGKPTHWRRGSFVLTNEEIIERAERNGWRPDAWKQLAA